MAVVGDVDLRRRLLLAAAGFGLLPRAARPAVADALAVRSIPGTDETLPVIGMGTWQTFDVGADETAREPLREVLSDFAHAGARVVDSSPMYGSAESVLGDLAHAAGLRERLFVATKVWTTGREAGIAQMRESMRRLRVERVDLMQVHNLVDAGTHLPVLREWKSRGRLRYLGLTHYVASAHDAVERLLRRERVDFLQINYSMAEREAAERLFPLAQERGIAVLVNRPFAEGALFERVAGRPVPAFAREELGCGSWAQVFLKFILAQPAVTAVLPATRNPAHLADNLGAGRGALPDAAQAARLLAAFETL